MLTVPIYRVSYSLLGLGDSFPGMEKKTQSAELAWVIYSAYNTLLELA